MMENNINFLKKQQNKITTKLTIDASAVEVEKFLVTQVNSLVDDINNLEIFKAHVYALFPKKINWNSVHTIDNRLKTVSTIFSTILSYKQELNRLLLKLQTILDPGLTDDTIKELIQTVQEQLKKTDNNTEEHRNKLNKMLKERPQFMPKKMGETNPDVIKK